MRAGHYPLYLQYPDADLRERRPMEHRRRVRKRLRRHGLRRRMRAWCSSLQSEYRCPSAMQQWVLGERSIMPIHVHGRWPLHRRMHIGGAPMRAHRCAATMCGFSMAEPNTVPGRLHRQRHVRRRLQPGLGGYMRSNSWSTGGMRQSQPHVLRRGQLASREPELHGSER